MNRRRADCLQHKVDYSSFVCLLRHRFVLGVQRVSRWPNVHYILFARKWVIQFVRSWFTDPLIMFHVSSSVCTAINEFQMKHGANWIYPCKHCNWVIIFGSRAKRRPTSFHVVRPIWSSLWTSQWGCLAASQTSSSPNAALLCILPAWCAKRLRLDLEMNRWIMCCGDEIRLAISQNACGKKMKIAWPCWPYGKRSSVLWQCTRYRWPLVRWTVYPLISPCKIINLFDSLTDRRCSACDTCYWITVVGSKFSCIIRSCKRMNDAVDASDSAAVCPRQNFSSDVYTAWILL